MAEFRNPLVFIALCLLATAAAQAQVVPVSQSRDIACDAYVEDFYDSDSGQDLATAPDMGPFAEGVGVTLEISGAYASGSAHQTSTIAPEGFDVVAGCAANGEGWDPDGWADASGSFSFICTFDVTEATTYTIAGWLEASDEGEAWLALTGPGVDVQTGVIYNDIVDVDETGELAPGTYTFQVDGQSVTSGDFYTYGYGYGGCDVGIDFTTGTAVPGLAREGLDVSVGPNPFAGRTRIAYASPSRAPVTLEVVDLRGRRARRLAAGAETGTLFWDGRDDAGRALPPGVYFVVSRSGDLVRRDKVTRVR